MPRSTMGELITFVRGLVSDRLSDAGPPVFDDDEIEAVLDTAHVDVRYQSMTPRPRMQAGTGVVLYYEYLAEPGFWEGGATFCRQNWVDVEAAEFDWKTGHASFEPQSYWPPVYISGTYYDVYRAAADLCERRAALTTEHFDVTVAGQTLKRSQKAQGWFALAKQYRARQFVDVVGMVRGDVSADIL